MSVRLAQCGPVERRIKQRAMDARRRIANAVPKQLAAPAVVGSRAPSVQDIVARFREIDCGPVRRYDAHVQVWRLHRKAVEDDCDNLPTLWQLRADFECVCPHAWNDIMSARRQRDVCLWRQAFMEAAKRYTNRTLPQIGRFLGGKDHTTVLHGYRVVSAAFEAGKAQVHRGPCGFTFRVRDTEWGSGQ